MSVPASVTPHRGARNRDGKTARTRVPPPDSALIAVVALPLLVATDVVISFFKLAGLPLFATTTGWMMAVRWASLLVVISSTVFLAILWKTAKIRAVLVGYNSLRIQKVTSSGRTPAARTAEVAGGMDRSPIATP